MGRPPELLETPVRFGETDLQGVVYYDEYFVYMDEAFTELLRRLGFPYPDIEAAGWTTKVVHAEMDYLGPAGLEDTLANGLRVATIGRSSLTGAYEAWQRESGETVARGQVVHVTVDVETGESIPVPQELRNALAELQDEPPEQAE